MRDQVYDEIVEATVDLKKGIVSLVLCLNNEVCENHLVRISGKIQAYESLGADDPLYIAMNDKS